MRGCIEIGMVAACIASGCSFNGAELAGGGSDAGSGSAGGDARTVGSDGGATDGGPTPSTIEFVADSVSDAANVAALAYTFSVPSGSNRFLLVSVELGTNCGGIVPDISSVTYAGVALTQVASVVGVPCDALGTRSDQWQLVAPPTGSNKVVVTLSSLAETVISGALAFTGVDQTHPVRGFGTASGQGTSSTVTVPSAVGDLVVNTTGQGTGISAPGAGATQRYLHDVDGSTTLNNAAASTAPGAANVTMTWTFTGGDVWQTISSALEP